MTFPYLEKCLRGNETSVSLMAFFKDLQNVYSSQPKNEISNLDKDVCYIVECGCF